MHRILSRVDPIRRHSPGTRYPARFVWVALGVFALPWLWTGTSQIVEGLERLHGGGARSLKREEKLRGWLGRPVAAPSGKRATHAVRLGRAPTSAKATQSMKVVRSVR